MLALSLIIKITTLLIILNHAIYYNIMLKLDSNKTRVWTVPFQKRKINYWHK